MTVIFDMDGVIVDNGEFHYRAWKTFCIRHQILFSKNHFKNVFFGRTNKQVLSDLFNDKLTPEELTKFALEKEQIYREIYSPYLKPVCGLIPFLKKLKAAKILVGVATSAPKENIDFILDGLDIRQFVDVIVDESMVVNGKPNPEIYLQTAELLKTKPAECVVFEDSLSGTKSAFDAGTKVIALTTTLPARKHKFAHQIIADFEDIQIENIS